MSSTDGDHRDYRYAARLAAVVSCVLNVCLLGPKVNSVEKLAELVRAGVNIGQWHLLAILGSI